MQYDSGRYIEFNIRDFEIPSGVIVRFYARKPSGFEVYNASDTNPDKVMLDGNRVKVNLTSQTLAETGIVVGEIQIIQGKTIISSFTFMIDVKHSIASQTAIESSNEYGVLDDLLNRAREDLIAIEEATERANDVADRAAAGEFTATLEVANVETGEPNEPVTIENVGTAQHAKWNIKIPQGKQGEQGVKGNSGIVAVASGMFALELEQDTGNLYAVYPDDAEITESNFEYDSETGNLYYNVE